MRIYTSIFDNSITKQISRKGNCINITACFMCNWDVCVEGWRKYCSWNLSVNLWILSLLSVSVGGWKLTEQKRSTRKDKFGTNMRHLHFCLVGNEVCFQGNVRAQHTLLFVDPCSHKSALWAAVTGKSLKLSNSRNYINSFKTYFFPSGCKINS